MTTAEILRGLQIVKAQDPKRRQPLRCSVRLTYGGSAYPSKDQCKAPASVVLYGEPRCTYHAEMDLAESVADREEAGRNITNERRYPG